MESNNNSGAGSGGGGTTLGMGRKNFGRGGAGGGGGQRGIRPSPDRRHPGSRSGSSERRFNRGGASNTGGGGEWSGGGGGGRQWSDNRNKPRGRWEHDDRVGPDYKPNSPGVGRRGSGRGGRRNVDASPQFNHKNSENRRNSSDWGGGHKGRKRQDSEGSNWGSGSHSGQVSPQVYRRSSDSWGGDMRRRGHMDGRHAGEGVDHDRSNHTMTSTPPAAPNASKPPPGRVRRPDAAVYVPRARRQQVGSAEDRDSPGGYSGNHPGNHPGSYGSHPGNHGNHPGNYGNHPGNHPGNHGSQPSNQDPSPHSGMRGVTKDNVYVPQVRRAEQDVNVNKPQQNPQQHHQQHHQHHQQHHHHRGGQVPPRFQKQQQQQQQHQQLQQQQHQHQYNRENSWENEMDNNRSWGSGGGRGDRGRGDRGKSNRRRRKSNEGGRGGGGGNSRSGSRSSSIDARAGVPPQYHDEDNYPNPEHIAEQTYYSRSMRSMTPEYFLQEHHDNQQPQQRGDVTSGRYQPRQGGSQERYETDRPPSRTRRRRRSHSNSSRRSQPSPNRCSGGGGAPQRGSRRGSDTWSNSEYQHQRLSDAWSQEEYGTYPSGSNSLPRKQRHRSSGGGGQNYNNKPTQEDWSPGALRTEPQWSPVHQMNDPWGPNDSRTLGRIRHSSGGPRNYDEGQGMMSPAMDRANKGGSRGRGRIRRSSEGQSEEYGGPPGGRSGNQWETESQGGTPQTNKRWARSPAQSRRKNRAPAAPRCITPSESWSSDAETWDTESAPGGPSGHYPPIGNIVIEVTPGGRNVSDGNSTPHLVDAHEYYGSPQHSAYLEESVRAQANDLSSKVSSMCADLTSDDLPTGTTEFPLTSDDLRHDLRHDRIADLSKQAKDLSNSELRSPKHRADSSVSSSPGPRRAYGTRKDKRDALPRQHHQSHLMDSTSSSTSPSHGSSSRGDAQRLIKHHHHHHPIDADDVSSDGQSSIQPESSTSADSPDTADSRALSSGGEQDPTERWSPGPVEFSSRPETGKQVLLVQDGEGVRKVLPDEDGGEHVEGVCKNTDEKHLADMLPPHSVDLTQVNMELNKDTHDDYYRLTMETTCDSVTLDDTLTADINSEDNDDSTHDVKHIPAFMVHADLEEDESVQTETVQEAPQQTMAPAEPEVDQQSESQPEDVKPTEPEPEQQPEVELDNLRANVDDSKSTSDDLEAKLNDDIEVKLSDLEVKSSDHEVKSTDLEVKPSDLEVEPTDQANSEDVLDPKPSDLEMTSPDTESASTPAEEQTDKSLAESEVEKQDLDEELKKEKEEDDAVDAAREPMEPACEKSDTGEGSRGSEAEHMNWADMVDDDDEGQDSWDLLFDETGSALDPKLLDELTIAVGKEVKVQKPQYDYYNYQPKEPDMDEYSHLLEIYDFPKELQTRDLLMAFKDFHDRGFDIKWVDDTHAIAVFSGRIAAQSALNMRHPLMKLRPMSQATRQTKTKAKRCAEFLEPYRPRPETTAAVARNLVTGALGLKTRVPREKRDAERSKLREARDKKRTAQKQIKDAWDGNFGRCAMDH